MLFVEPVYAYSLLMVTLVELSVKPTLILKYGVYTHIIYYVQLDKWLADNTYFSRIFLIDTKKQIQQPTGWYDV